MRHRAIRIGIRRFLEGTDRGGMIEPVNESKALIEVTLRLRIFRGDFACVSAEIVAKRLGLGVERERGETERQRKEKAQAYGLHEWRYTSLAPPQASHSRYDKAAPCVCFGRSQSSGSISAGLRMRFTSAHRDRRHADYLLLNGANKTCSHSRLVNVIEFMDDGTLEILLNKTEGDTLDFKSQQYALCHGSNEEKSELLKDILALANAWKETDAYIVIGVCETDGRADGITGVTIHLADNDVQQFVNTKTNKPVIFSVETVQHGTVELDIIKVARKQNRPVYCRRAYGKVKESAVYLRRGSSTAIADPEEISAMGKADAAIQVRPIPTLAIEFADPDRRLRFGLQTEVVSTTIENPSPKRRQTNESPRSIYDPIRIVDPLAPKFSDWISYLKKSVFLQPLGFWVINTGISNITNARIDARLPRASGLVIVDRSEGPREPMYGLKTDFAHLHDSVVLYEEPDEFLIQFEYARLQPKSQSWSPGLVYVGATSSVDCECHVSVFADDLSNPMEFELTLHVNAIHRPFDQAELSKLMNV